MPENIAENTENVIENNQDKTENVSETNSVSNTQERSYESNAFYEMTSFGKIVLKICLLILRTLRNLLIIRKYI